MKVNIFQGNRPGVENRINEWLEGDGKFAASGGLKFELSTSCKSSGEVVVTILASWSE